MPRTDAVRSIRSFISSARWQRLRLRQLKLHPLCECCRKKGLTVLADEVHHILPCHDNPVLQVAMSNLESLCRPCHAPLQAADNRGFSRAIDSDGYPVDPSTQPTDQAASQFRR